MTVPCHISPPLCGCALCAHYKSVFSGTPWAVALWYTLKWRRPPCWPWLRSIVSSPGLSEQNFTGWFTADISTNHQSGQCIYLSNISLTVLSVTTLLLENGCEQKFLCYFRIFLFVAEVPISENALRSIPVAANKHKSCIFITRQSWVWNRFPTETMYSVLTQRNNTLYLISCHSVWVCCHIYLWSHATPRRCWKLS